VFRFYRPVLFSAICLSALAVASCSMGGNLAGVVPLGPAASPSASPTASAAAVLVAGKVAQYTGTDVTAFVYASPGPTQANYTAGYTFAQTTTVNAAATGAPAPFDVNVATTYTTTQTPTTGFQHISQIVDNYESQTASGASETVALVASKSVTVDTDLTAGANGGGPYTSTSTVTTTYASPRAVGVYPLVTGEVTTPTIARTATTSTTDVNAAGTRPNTTFPVSVTQSYASDGSTTKTSVISNGEQNVFTESSNGSATENVTGPIYLAQETIGVPVPAAGVYTIPYTYARQDVQSGPTPVPTITPRASNAADWYPGGALPPSPLVLATVTVKGPATALPGGCSGAIAEPNVVEVDSVQSSLNVNGTYETQTQQTFDSNGTAVCVLRTTTTRSYDNSTGLLLVTATEAYAQILTSLTSPSPSARIMSTLRSH